jgi:hypothetical protein
MFRFKRRLGIETAITTIYNVVSSVTRREIHVEAGYHRRLYKTSSN